MRACTAGAISLTSCLSPPSPPATAGTAVYTAGGEQSTASPPPADTHTCSSKPGRGGDADVPWRRLRVRRAEKPEEEGPDPNQQRQLRHHIEAARQPQKVPQPRLIQQAAQQVPAQRGNTGRPCIGTVWQDGDCMAEAEHHLFMGGANTAWQACKLLVLSGFVFGCVIL